MNKVTNRKEIPLLEAKGLVKHFNGRKGLVKALDGVDIALYAGKSLGLVGESGAGKSTILNLLLGLDRQDAGSILFRGEKIDTRNHAGMVQFRREVQVVFQDPKTSMNPRMRIGAILSEPLRSLRIEGDHAKRVRDVLMAVGLDPDTVERYPHEFSGGQRQRIAIARAIASSPKVLIGDEPVSALDVSVRSQILDLFDQLKSTMDLSLILVSHDLAVVGRMCDHIVVLKNGYIAEAGDTRSIFINPASAYTKRLLDSVPTLPDS